MNIVWPAAAPAAAGQSPVLPCDARYLRIPRQGQPDQAAFARRIRRRRSEARSSSFRPPQVPYFSGLEIA